MSNRTRVVVLAVCILILLGARAMMGQDAFRDAITPAMNWIVEYGPF